MLSALVIPDPQVKTESNLAHLDAAANYACEMGTDIVICLGDFRDMPSLCSHDSDVSRAWSRATIEADLAAGDEAIEIMKKRWRRWQPGRKIMLRGNHDCDYSSHGRIGRWRRDFPREASLLDTWIPNEVRHGWEVVPFLEHVEIEGTLFSHLFNVSSRGLRASKPAGAANAQVMLQGVGQSCIAGHKQGLDYGMVESPAGRKRSIIAGSFYMEELEYLGRKRDYWKGILHLENMKGGWFDVQEVSMNYLLEAYQ